MNFKAINNILLKNGADMKISSPFPKNVLWGAAPTGDIHIGYLPTLGYLKQLKKQGSKVIIFIGDYHAYLDGEKTAFDELASRSSYYAETFINLGFEKTDIVFAKNTYVQGSYIELLFRFSNYLPTNELLIFADSTLKNKTNGSYSFGDLLYVATQILDVVYFQLDLVICGLDESGIYKLGLPIAEKFLSKNIDYAFLGLVPGVFTKEMHASNDITDKISVHEDVNSISEKLHKSNDLYRTVVEYILPVYNFHKIKNIQEASEILFEICHDRI